MHSMYILSLKIFNEIFSVHALMTINTVKISSKIKHPKYQNITCSAPWVVACIGAPHAILKMYRVYPYTIYSIGVDPIY